MYPIGSTVTCPPRDTLLRVVAYDQRATVDGPVSVAVCRLDDGVVWSGERHFHAGHSQQYAAYTPDELAPACEHWPCTDHAEFGAMACGWCKR